MSNLPSIAWLLLVEHEMQELSSHGNKFLYKKKETKCNVTHPAAVGAFSGEPNHYSLQVGGAYYYAPA